jgi:nicotinamide-nucleotide amidase
MSKNVEHLVSDIADFCNQLNLNITTVESCTGGGIAYALTSIAGSSAWFKQSFVTYSNDAKSSLVHVSEKTLRTYGAVSEETVKEMALGGQQVAKADIALSVSGIAGPDGGSAEKPVGTVWFAWAIHNTVYTDKVLFSGDRNSVREQAISYSLSCLIKHLQKIS